MLLQLCHVDVCNGPENLVNDLLAQINVLALRQQELHTVLRVRVCVGQCLGESAHLVSVRRILVDKLRVRVLRELQVSGTLREDINEYILEQSLNLIGLNLEARILWLHKDEAGHCLEGHDHFADETSIGVDAWRRLIIVLSHIVDWHSRCVVDLLGGWQNELEQVLLELGDSLLLSEALSALASSLLRLCGFLSQTNLLVLLVESTLLLILDRLLVLLGPLVDAVGHHIVKGRISLHGLLHFEGSLFIQLWNEDSSHLSLTGSPQKSTLSYLLQRVSLEEFQELLGHHTGNVTSFLSNEKHLLGPLLQVSALAFRVESILASLHALSLNQHGFPSLLEVGLALSQHAFFIFFDHLDACLLERLSNEYLQDRLHFNVVVKEISFDIPYLDRLVSSLFLFDEDGTWWPVDVIVGGNRALVHHVVPVVKGNPITGRHHRHGRRLLLHLVQLHVVNSLHVLVTLTVMLVLF